MCNLIDAHTHKCEGHRMTRMAGPECGDIYNFINTHKHTDTDTDTDAHTHTHTPLGRINASGIE